MNISHISSPHRRPPLSAWRLCLALITLLALGATARAADFYVDAQAAAGGNGSAGSPWNSVAQVNSHGAFAAGDRIFFNRGDTFAGTGLVVQGSGTSNSARITYGAYPATGNRPIIDSNSSTVNCVSITNRSWITIQDLDLSSPNGNAPLNLTGLNCNNGSNINVLRVRTAWTAGSGLTFVQGGDILLDGCEAFQFGGGAFYLKGSDTNRIHDVTIQNCIAHDARTGTNADGFTLHDTSAGIPIGDTFILRDNLAYNCNEQGFDLTSGTNILLEHNESYGNKKGAFDISHHASNVTIRYHLSENEPADDTANTIKIAASNVTIEYSTFVGSPFIKPVVLITPSVAGGTTVDAQPEDVVLRNNVFMWNAGSGSIFSLANNSSFVPTIQRLTMQNNIWGNLTTTGIPTLNFAVASRPPNYATFKILNNLYDDAPATRWVVNGSPYNTFAAYKAAFNPPPNPSWNEKTGNPAFVNAGAGDFHLTSGSPARDAGTSTLVNGEDAMLTADFNLPTPVTVPQGGVRDIGAYEFPVSGGSPPNAPSNLVASAPTSSAVNLSWVDNANIPNNETQFRIQRKTGTGAFGPLATPAADLEAFTDTTVAAGTTYTYQIQSENANGSLGYVNSSPVQVPAAGTTVTVTATDASASESGLNPGTFTFTRSSTVGALTVNFTLATGAGRATSGTDYASIGTTVSFIAGQNTAIKTVTPIQDTTVEGAETVLLTLAASAGYTVGSPSAATVTIADNDYLFEAESPALAPVSNLGGTAISNFLEGGASPAGNGSNSLLASTQNGDYITYTINVPVAGTYNITFAGAKYTSRGTCKLFVNGSATQLGADIPLYYAGPGYSYTPLFNQGNVALNAGNNTLKFQVSAAGAGGGRKLSFDYFRVTQ